MRKLLAGALCLAWALPAFAQEVDEAVARELEKAVPADFWGVVLVAKDGRPLLHKAWGKADYVNIPNTVDTLFEIASSSKTVTAAAALKLEMQGKLKLDATLDSLFKNVPKDLKPITVQQIVNHTSGIDPADCIIPYGSPMSRDEFVAVVLRSKLKSKPGEKFEYNNGAYAFLAAIVEIAAGKPFEDYVRENLFVPAGMTRTGFVNEKGFEGQAAASRKDRHRGEEITGTSSKWLYGWGYRGMGGVVTTAEDVLKWDRALRGDKLFDEATKKKMYTPAHENYACGWLVHGSPHGKKVEHSGSVAGFLTQFARYMDKDITVIVLTNEYNDIFGIESKLADAAFAAADAPDSGVTLSLLLQGVKLSPAGGYEVAKGTEWRVGKDGSGAAVLELREGMKARAKVTIPAPLAKSLTARLEELVQAKGKEGLKDGTMASGLFTAGYAPQKGEVSLDRNLRVVLKEKHETNDAVDPRITLIVADDKSGGRPLIVKMGAAKAKTLAAELRKVVGK